MGGRRTTKGELIQLEALTEEGLTTGEIAQRLGRSAAAIRNLRYKKGLIAGTEDEIKVLLQQRDELTSTVKALQEEIGKLEATLRQDRDYMRHEIAEILIKLKAEKPELFSTWWLPFSEQISKLTDAISAMKEKFK
jgi:plasmid maintenance system antidote protein VapI